MTALPQPNKMTADEYLQTPETNLHTELLDGEIVNFASPTVLHQEIVGGIYAEIRQFIRTNHGDCKPMIAPFDVKIDDMHVVQPDVLVVCDPSKLNEKFCNGAPDWVVEVLSDNRQHDLRYKLGLYQDAGVREYWIVDPKSRKTLVYFFEKNDLPDIYTFDTPIPVEIYNRELSIKIADLA